MLDLHHRQRLGSILFTFTAVVCAVAVGALSAAPEAGRLVVASVGVGALVTAAALATRRIGAAVPIVGLLAMAIGALPGVANRTSLVTGIDVTDAAILGLVATLVLVNALQGWHGFRSPVARIIAWCGAALLLWWLFVLVRTTTGQDAGPLVQAARYGRDFAYFALLLPLFVGAMGDPTLRRRVLLGLFGLAAVTALAESAASLGVASLGFIVHSSHGFEQNGVQRIYTDAADLVTVTFFFALGTAIFAARPVARNGSLVLAALCLVDIALALGRAKYIGLIVGVVVSTLVWWSVAGSGRRLAGICGALGVVLVAVLLIAPTSRPAAAVGGVSSRLASTFSDASADVTVESQNTFAYRKRVQDVMRQRLGDEDAWLVGLGFRSPSFDYDPDLPGGEIRNSDVGYFGPLMTMGLIGTGLLLLPVLLAGLALLRSRTTDGADPALMWAGLALCVYGLVTAASLVLLFSPTGLAVTAAALGIALAAVPRSSVRGARRPSVA